MQRSSAEKICAERICADRIYVYHSCGLQLRYTQIHTDIVADGTAHDKQMKQFVCSETRNKLFQQRKLQRVNHSAHGIDDSSGQKPYECLKRKCKVDITKSKDTQPAHSDIENGGEPFRTGNPEQFEDDACQGNSPDQDKQTQSLGSAENHDTYRCVGTGNEDENHTVVDFFQLFICAWAKIKGMVGSAGAIQKNHTEHKNAETDKIPFIICMFCTADQKQRQEQDRGKESDKVGQSTDWILNLENRLFKFYG